MDNGRLKNILVATNHLHSIGGTEMYTYYLIKALSGMPGLRVEYFTLKKGEISLKIEKELGVGFRTKRTYDLIIANHFPVVKRLFKDGPIIQVCHGVSHDLEKPWPYADLHIAVSEEVARHLASQGIRSQVVLNGIDTEVFKPSRELNKEVRTILSLCQGEEANRMLQRICEDKGITLLTVNKFKNPTFDIAAEINKADLVVGLGRSVYDAMACGRPGVIFDSRPYMGVKGDGYLCPDKFREYVRYNCSGRYSNSVYNTGELAAEILQYDPRHGPLLRNIAVEQLDVRKMAAQMITAGSKLGLHAKVRKQLRILGIRRRELTQRLSAKLRRIVSFSDHT